VRAREAPRATSERRRQAQATSHSGRVLVARIVAHALPVEHAARLVLQAEDRVDDLEHQAAIVGAQQHVHARHDALAPVAEHQRVAPSWVATPTRSDRPGAAGT
jgi:hypothetical protein